MAATDETGDRRVVPRWKSLRDALHTGELDGALVNKSGTLDGTQFIVKKEQAWRENTAL